MTARTICCVIASVLVTGAVEIVPTSTPEWMTYDPQTREFSGVPDAGEHELAVKVMDAGTGQTATGTWTSKSRRGERRGTL
jgi:hypothetical protein